MVHGAKSTARRRDHMQSHRPTHPLGAPSIACSPPDRQLSPGNGRAPSIWRGPFPARRRRASRGRGQPRVVWGPPVLFACQRRRGHRRRAPEGVAARGRAAACRSDRLRPVGVRLAARPWRAPAQSGIIAATGTKGQRRPARVVRLRPARRSTSCACCGDAVTGSLRRCRSCCIARRDSKAAGRHQALRKRASDLRWRWRVRKPIRLLAIAAPARAAAIVTAVWTVGRSRSARESPRAPRARPDPGRSGHNRTALSMVVGSRRTPS